MNSLSATGTPIHHAVRRKSPDQKEIVEELLRAGADVNLWPSQKYYISYSRPDLYKYHRLASPGTLTTPNHTTPNTLWHTLTEVTSLYCCLLWTPECVEGVEGVWGPF